jgi:hypothetical protein
MMALSDLFARLSPSRRRAEQAEKARDELKANAEKALRMKQEAGPSDHIPAREGYFEPELKRTKVARSGDAS